MYVTAQRVRSRSSREGINAFLSLHQGQESPGIDWARPAVMTVAEQYPGTLVDSELDLTPGGNAVRSFLDVVAADGTGLERLRTALEAFGRELESAALPHMALLDGVGIRFHAESSLEDERVDEYRVLKTRLLRLMERQVATLP